jgi:hypothetical protein
MKSATYRKVATGPLDALISRYAAHRLFGTDHITVRYEICAWPNDRNE